MVCRCPRCLFDGDLAYLLNDHELACLHRARFLKLTAEKRALAAERKKLQESLGKNRIIADPAEIARRAPDIIIGSWCGKKFRPERVAERAAGVIYLPPGQVLGDRVDVFNVA